MNRKDYRKRKVRKRRAAILKISLSAAIVLSCTWLANGALKDGRHYNEYREDYAGGISVFDIEAESVSKNEVKSEISEPSEKEDTAENAVNSEHNLPEYLCIVPESEEADNEYFDDAVFIGDSRTQGFMLYSGLSNAKYLASVGLMVDTAFKSKVIYDGDEKLTVMEALEREDFSKVYIMLGINELGWVYSSVFKQYYGNIVDRVLQINPDAYVYIQSILPVSRKRSNDDIIYNNSKIEEYNLLLKELAEEKGVYYLDIAEAVKDDEGFLPEDASFDGIHLKPEYCKKWCDYIKNHVICKEKDK